MFRFMSLLVAGCVGAMLASQAPQFMQQYNQRLGGAIDELAIVVRHFDQDAKVAGMDRASAIERYTRSGDTFFVRRGQSVQTAITRWHDMSDHWRALASSNIFTKLPVFLSGADKDLISRTWQSYKPAIPTTPEGLAYSGVGFFITHLIFGSFLSLFRRRRYTEPARQERYFEERVIEEKPVRRRTRQRAS